jgi:hypothetical protein
VLILVNPELCKVLLIILEELWFTGNKVIDKLTESAVKVINNNSLRQFYSKHVVNEFYIHLTLVAVLLTLDLNMNINDHRTNNENQVVNYADINIFVYMNSLFYMRTECTLTSL